MKNFKFKYLSKNKKPYYIAEIGINHNGYLSLAKKMVKKSKEAGADAVKFQKRDIDDILNFRLKNKKPIGYLSKNEFDIPKTKIKFGGWVYPDIRLELKFKDYKEIKRYCKKLKIDLIITPWDESSVEFVKNLGVKAFKIASIDANNYHFCDYIAKKRKPTIISTGMCTYKELKITNNIFNKYRTPHMFMHCTSAYPSRPEDKNLNCIPKLRKTLNTEIGFSGHGISFFGPAGSIPLGVKVIEKHVTLNKNMAGPDHLASLNFDQFKEMIDFCNNLDLSLGNDSKKFLKSERILHSILTRRIVARKNLKKGQKLKFEDIKTVLTYSNKGCYPNKVFSLINKKLKNDITLGSPIETSVVK
tara:strand:+ start:11974 stop:13050 length:1077 start_codon:yes stop_codon:yes gene_type:complete